MSETLTQTRTREMLQLPVAPMSVRYYEKFRPFKPWGNKETVLHEESHMSRVLVLGNLLGQNACQAGHQIDIEAVLSAVRIHDIFRTSDDEDELDHGLHAAQWAASNGIFRGNPSEELIYFLTTWHSQPDELAPEFPIELSVIKDADALDRVRGFDDLDERFLRLSQSHSLIPFGRKLYEFSSIDPSTDPFTRVMRAGQRLGVII